MITETAWFAWLIELKDADKISTAIVSEIKSGSDMARQLFEYYNLPYSADCPQLDYENLCNKLYKLNHK